MILIKFCMPFLDDIFGKIPQINHHNWNDIKNNAGVTVNNDFLGLEWGDLPMIFTSDEVASENHG